VSALWRVKLPPSCRPPFEVYVNGVRQVEGSDFERHGRVLLFDRPLAKEGRLGVGRWLLGSFGIGTYRKNDVVDVRYEVGGRPQVAHALDIEPPVGG
jgi:hypothetical protein